MPAAQKPPVMVALTAAYLVALSLISAFELYLVSLSLYALYAPPHAHYSYFYTFAVRSEIIDSSRQLQ